MRQIHRAAHVIALSVLAVIDAAPAWAQGYGSQYPYFFNNQTYQYGLNLPQVPIPNGSDEIRAADGTTCKSNTASNNAYLDVGAIGSQDIDGAFSQGSVYGRIIVPLGSKPKRIDCTALYQLEIQRLQSELQLVRAGMAGGSKGGGSIVPQHGAANKGPAWAEQGWSNEGSRAADKPKGAMQAGLISVARPQPAQKRRELETTPAVQLDPWTTTVTKYIHIQN